MTSGLFPTELIAPAEGRTPLPRERLWAVPAARARIQLIYFWRHGRMARIDDALSFTELVQQRKLHDRDPRMVALADKVTVKRHVAELLGHEWVIPILWHGRKLPPAPPWPAPFVVKSRAGCGQHAFVRTGDEDWPAIVRQARRWTRRPYGSWLDEWAYRGIEPGLLIEPFIGADGVLPVDYKLFVFGGRVRFVQVHLEREHRHRWILFDTDWTRASAATTDADPPPPASLAAMIAAAEVLAHDWDFVRVDFYEAAGRPLFGEMTFYPGSGLYPLDPPHLDDVMGAYWRDARRRRGSAL